MARHLSAWTSGDRLVSVEVYDERMPRQSGLPLSVIEGQTLGAAYRRAKYAVLPGEEHALILHFRMTGKVVRTAGAREPRATFRFAAGAPVHFVDTRRFGTIDAVSLASIDEYFAARRIAAEPWPERRDGTWWSEQLAGLTGPIKPGLMKQERVAGLGNILASEILWSARILPTTPVPALTDAQWASLAVSAHEVIERTLALEQGDEIAYVNEGGDPEGSGFAVYGREGEPARCCGGPVVRIVQSGRSTFYCPSCQTS